MSCGCHRRPLESFLRQYPRQLPMWRHTRFIFFFHIFFILSLPVMSFCLFFFVVVNFPWRILHFKQTRSPNRLVLESKAGKMGETLQVLLPKSQRLLPSSCSRTTELVKSFSRTALSQPLLAPFQKCAACFRKMEGTSLHGECCLPALVTSALALSLWLSLSLSLSFSLRLRQATALLPSVRQAQLSVQIFGT